jgi:hypothetical protein
MISNGVPNISGVMSMQTQRFMRGALAVTALATLVAIPAHAVVVTNLTPINVPNTFDGVYINLLTGATGTSGASVPGWDINPYNSGTALSFFWNGTPAGSSGGVATAATAGQYIDLPMGSFVSGASTFTAITAAAATVQFQSPGTHYLGFRFFNEATAAVNYGYLAYQSNGSNGFPGTILGWAYDNSGAGITVSVIPEPGTYALMLAGLAVVGGIAARRRKDDAPA